MSHLEFRNPLRRKLKAGKLTFGTLSTLESATVSEVAADLGLDWVLIDMEHGSLSFRDVVDHIRALKGSDTAAIVRVATSSVDNIKRALDLGAHAVFIPLVRRREDVEDAFRHARYPMVGERGLGGERAVRWGLNVQQYVSVADEETMVIPIIETADCIRNMEDILSVPGIEAVFYGPGDLSQSMGTRGTWEGGGVDEAMRRTSEMARSKNITTGVIGRDIKEMDERIAQGYRMIGLGSDIKLMITQIRHVLDHAKKYR